MRKSIHLEYLKKGDLVAIVSIAKYITKKDCQLAVKYIKREGLDIVNLNKTILKRRGMFSGSNEERIEMLQSILDSPKVKAIFFARGGYGSIRILDKLNFSLFIKNPKWLIGFSDITVFLSHISKMYNFPTLHAPMPFNFPTTSKNELKKLFRLLFGVKNPIKIIANRHNRKGTATGKLIGGNLSILCSLLNSESFPKTKGAILLIEDISEYLYSIDRMIYSLKRSGVFENISGLIVGKFTNIKDNKPTFGQSMNEIIIQAVSEYKFPICFDFPVGHVKKNKPVIFFQDVKLKVSNFVELIYVN